MAEAADFDAVETGSLLDYPVSPVLDRDITFRGIRINGPRAVPLAGKPDRRGGFARMMVCGTYHLDSNYLGLEEDFRDHLLIVAVNAASHEARIARLPGIPNPYPSRVAGGSDLTPDDWLGRSVVEYFNVNLVSLLALPEVAADYVVYATLGDFVSNVLRMRLAEP
jgi:hypothetical protein